MYLLDKSRFVSEPGLGTMEKVTRDPKANLGRVEFDRRAAVDELVESGQVKLSWAPR